jgi:branched-chain amino acid aminotransferase
MTVWCNGRLVADDEPVLRADDHGFVVGDGVFETLKVVDGQPFALTRHLRRMQRSAHGLGLPWREPTVRAAVDEVMAADRELGGLRRLRITLTGGPGPYGSDRGDAGTTLVVATSDQPRPPESSAVATVPWTRNERSPLTGLKTTSYAENVVALQHAHERGAAEAIFANSHGELCEGTGTNVFVAVDGRLVTPPLSSGCLPGVTRSLILEWVEGIDERSLPLGVLDEAEEIFLSSSIRDVHPVHAVNGREIAEAPGPLTRHAMDVFARRAAESPDP